MRLYERVLQGAATQRKWDAQVWAGFTAEQKANLQELEKLLGIRKGRPMTHAQADEGRTNPLYNNPANKGKRYYKVTKSGRLVKNPAWDDQYSVNCQTTVPTYLLRRWGFNVEALGNKKGDVWKKLGGGYTNVWKNKKGEIGFGLRFQETTTRTVNMFDWLSQQPDGIYQVQCTWKGGKNGHTWCYVKENGKGFMYDPQNNKTFKNMAEFKEYSQNVSPKYGYHYFRIDDLRINNGAMSKMVQQYTERIDPVEAARIKRHATRDADAIKQAWRNRLRDNLAKEITAEAMKSDAARARLKAFENAVKADDAAAIRREYYRAKQGLQVQKQWTEQRKALAAIENEANAIKAKVAGYKEVDTTKLDNLMRYRLHKAEAEINKLKLQNAAIEMTKKDIEDLIPDADKWLKQFTAEELKKAHSAIEKKLAQLAHLPLEKQQNSLLFEIKFVENPPLYKAGSIKYPTWQVSQNAYKRKLTEIQDKIWWKNKDEEYKDLLSFKISSKTKSAKLALALQDYKDAVAVGDKLKASKALSEANSTKASLEKAAATRAAKRRAAQSNVGKDVVLQDIPRAEADRLIAAFEAEYGDSADNILRKMTEADWKNLSPEEKIVLTKYTQTYSYLNEPLRGKTYYSPNQSKKKAEFNNDMPLLTEALSKQTMQQNAVVRRGTGDYHIPAIGKRLSQVQAGDEFVDGAFLSTAVRTDKGLGGTYNMVIVVPKGAQGMYAEPFSHYTDSLRYDYASNNLWNGVTKESMGREREWIGQRGSKFRVLKKKGNTIYLQLIGQLFDQVADPNMYI